MQFMEYALRVSFPEFDQVNNIAYEQANVVQRVIELMCHASSKLSKCCQFARLY